jgi:transaldolase
MKLFLDTANLTHIRDAALWGVLSGVTTNPSLLAKDNHREMKQVIQEISALVPQGPVSVEVMADDAPGMIKEGLTFNSWADNIAVKVPMTPEGIKAVKYFSSQGIHTNVTLVFSVNQALLAAAAGATYISAFVGRVDDTGYDGMTLIKEIVDVCNAYAIDSEVLAASIRHPLHVTQAAAAGADIATIPYAILAQMYRHPLTDKGVSAFKADWDQLHQQADKIPA